MRFALTAMRPVCFGVRGFTNLGHGCTVDPSGHILASNDHGMMMKISWRRCLAILLPVCALCGCSSERTSADVSKDRSVKSTAEAPVDSKTAAKVRRDVTLAGVKPAEDDALVLFYNDDPDTLNVLTSNDSVSEAFHRVVYEPLAMRKYADPDTFEPRLAESWEFDKDKLEYTIHLRKGVKWHPMKLPNGKLLPSKELSAKDVKFTFDCVLNKHIEATHLRSYFEDPDAKDEASRYKIKVSIVDAHTVKVRWTKPYFLSDEYTLNIDIMPQHVYAVDENGEPISINYTSKQFADGFNNHWANTRMCGTGPMVFNVWKKDERVVFDRNDDYWGEPYYFNKLIYRRISNPNTALQLTLQNELDWASIPEKDHFLQSKKHPNVISGKVKLEEFQHPGYRYMGYNQSRDFFKDKQVRWALSHTVPVDTIIEKVYFGLADRLTGPFLPGSSAYDSSLKPVSYDLDEAGKLLDAAGWKDTDEDGIRDKIVDGKKISAEFDLMIYSESPQYLTIAQIVKENCRKVGVSVTISPSKWALMLQKLRKKEFDACILGWMMSWKNDPYQIFHSSQADLPDSSNSIGYHNPKVDKLIEKLRVTMEPEEQSKLYHQIHKAIYDDQPYTFLFQDRGTAGRDARLENIHFYKIRPGYDTREWHSSKPRELGR